MRACSAASSSLRVPHERLDAPRPAACSGAWPVGRAELRAQLLELAREAVLTMAQRHDVRRGGLLALHGVTQRGDLVRGRRLGARRAGGALGDRRPGGEARTSPRRAG